MTCFLCSQAITSRQKIEYHHPTYKSRGGKQTAPSHKRCHRQYHISNGDFREWGKRAAASKRWAFHLLNVRTHPAYEPAREFYLMNHASAGWGEGLI